MGSSGFARTILETAHAHEGDVDPRDRARRASVRTARYVSGVNATSMTDALRRALLATRAGREVVLATVTLARARAREAAEAVTTPVREAVASARETLATVDLRLGDLEDVARRIVDRHGRGPIDADTTVHAALARSPRTAAALARRGLPACADCAVGADETLAEAAFGEGFDLDGLLAELREDAP
jgi:hypothetical protein